MKVILIRSGSGQYLTSGNTLTTEFCNARVFPYKSVAEKKVAKLKDKIPNLQVEVRDVGKKKEVPYSVAAKMSHNELAEYKLAVRYDGPYDVGNPSSLFHGYFSGDPAHSYPIHRRFVGQPKLFRCVEEATALLTLTQAMLMITPKTIADSWKVYYGTLDNAMDNLNELSQVLNGKNLTVCLMA